MSLKTMTLNTAVTGPLILDGSSRNFVEDGVVIPNGLHLVDSSVEDFRSRPQLTVKNRLPVYDKKTNDYSKDKKSMTLIVPQTLANGKTVFHTLRIEREVHPDALQIETYSVNTMLNSMAAQLLLGTDAGQFWSNGSLS